MSECSVYETRNVGACSIQAKGRVPNGGSVTFGTPQAGQQTAACSNGSVVWLTGICPSSEAAAPRAPLPAKLTNRLPLSLTQLLQFSADTRLAHQGVPQGVPNSYSWYSGPVSDHWNSPPPGYTAITGWSQAFWTATTRAPSAHLQVQHHQTLICHGLRRRWVQVQKPQPVQGAQFRPDYADNANVALPFFARVPSGNVAGWGVGQAFHFWPADGRGALPQDGICGVVVLIQARALPISANAYETPNILLGLGADYWLSASAPWANYTTNAGLGVGRLKLVGTDWDWYGFSTASEADLTKLFTNGFETVSP